MSNDINKAYSEVSAILNLLDDEFISKLPKKFIQFINTEKDNEYNVQINPNVGLEEQKLLPDTINILALLKLDYWCETKEEKEELLSLLNQNEEEYQKKLKERYNPDNIFNKKIKTEEETTKEKGLSIVKEKSFITKLFEKLKNIFKVH